MTDLTLPIRQGVVTLLRSDVPLRGLLGDQPAPQYAIYGMRQPVDAPYPFVRYGSPNILPFTASCLDGSTVTVDLHAFAGGPGESEDQACAIAGRVVMLLDGARLDLGGDNYALIKWTGGQTFRDIDEQDIWHAVRTFDIEGVA